MLSAIATGAVALAGFFVWLVRKVFQLEARLNKDYMERKDIIAFVERILGPVNSRLTTIHSDMQAGFRDVNKRLDRKADRGNGTG